MKHNSLRRLRQRAGESLAETLAALLIATLGLTMLPAAIVTAARINRRAEQQYVRAEKKAPAEVSFNTASGNGVRLQTSEDTDTEFDILPIKVYRDDPGADQTGGSYFFYEAP